MQGKPKRQQSQLFHPQYGWLFTITVVGPAAPPPPPCIMLLLTTGAVLDADATIAAFCACWLDIICIIIICCIASGCPEAAGAAEATAACGMALPHEAHALEPATLLWPHSLQKGICADGRLTVSHVEPPHRNS